MADKVGMNETYNENPSPWFKDSGGDGGIAGQGGNVKVSKTASIHAFNGNECTLSSNNLDYYYKPLEIFGQNGIHRAVYKNNLWWNVMDTRTISFFESIWGVGKLTEEAYSTTIATSTDEMKNIIVKDYYETEPLKYTIDDKTYNVGQGIGTGAGYIELSNGTYTIDNSLN